MVKTKLVPPDGGYGWAIVAAYAIHHLIATPTMQIYGLLFKDVFHDLGFTATDTTLVLNTHTAIAMFMGIANGPSLKRFGYRKMSVCGAILFTAGILGTAYAHTITQYMVSFSLIAAIGVGIGLASYPVAFNSYFMENRGKAASYALTISGLGIVFMPQVISILLSTYGIKGSVLIMGGITSHVFITAILLHPVEWHMKKEIIATDEDGLEDGVNGSVNNQVSASKVLSQEELDIESKYNVSAPFSSVLSLHTILQRSKTATDTSVSLLSHSDSEENNRKSKGIQNEEKDKRQSTFLRRITTIMVETFDLALLKDPIYVNIMFGISIALFGEMNFSILMPFIMSDYGLSTSQIATFISVMAMADICSRFLAPYVSHVFKQSARMMYLWNLIIVIFARFTLLLTNSFYLLLVCAAFVGITRGFRAVYLSLVIPNHVPIEKLASALGLQSAVNGTLIWLGAPFFGFIRDVTGSYKRCLFIINAFSFLTTLMWGLEFIYVRCKSKNAAIDLKDIE